MKRVPSDMEQEAAAWAARLDAGAWSADDEAALQDWLTGDRRRRGALLHAQATWAMLDVTMPVLVGDETEGQQVRSRPGAIFTRRHVMMAAGGALAASVIGGVMLGRDVRYTTDFGEIRRVPLSDGSTAAINTASAVAVRFESRRRSVDLEQGEAWFHVAHDTQRPFVVSAGVVRVQAVGTAFAVRRRDTATDISVTEGVVKIWSVAGTAASPADAISIAAGGHATFDDGQLVDHARNDELEIDRRLSWREGKVDFADATLGEAAAEFNRYNRRRLVIADPALATERLDGTFSVDDVQGFALAIRKSLRVPVNLGDGEVRIGERTKILTENADPTLNR